MDDTFFLFTVHGGWSAWESWGMCSTTCGVGMRSRKRSCTNPRPYHFKDHCFGESVDYELCNIKSCAGIAIPHLTSSTVFYLIQQVHHIYNINTHAKLLKFW